MSARASMVDQGRIVSKESTGTKIEGTTFYAPKESEWFRMRYEPPRQAQDNDDARPRTSKRSSPALLDTRDKKGNPLNFDVKQKIEIDSKEYGRVLVEITNVVPIRKKRRISHWEADFQIVQS